MREIKFRGKTSEGEWKIGDINQNKRGQVFICISFCGGWDVIPESVGQFTGLKDKNGKESYSGDISIDEHKRKWVVIDVPGGFAHVRDIHFNKPMFEFVMTSLGDIQNAHHFSRKHEIIGNIYENPELLEKR